MPETVCLETSIFSFHYERRLDPAAVAMREWTRTWWDAHRHRYSVATPLQLMGE